MSRLRVDIPPSPDGGGDKQKLFGRALGVSDHPPVRALRTPMHPDFALSEKKLVDVRNKAGHDGQERF
jgi:hypothetical protein